MWYAGKLVLRRDTRIDSHLVTFSFIDHMCRHSEIKVMSDCSETTSSSLNISLYATQAANKESEDKIKYERWLI